MLLQLRFYKSRQKTTEESLHLILEVCRMHRHRFCHAATLKKFWYWSQTKEMIHSFFSPEKINCFDS